MRIPRSVRIISEPEIDSAVGRQENRVARGKGIVHPTGCGARAKTEKEQRYGGPSSDPGRWGVDLGLRLKEESSQDQGNNEEDRGNARRGDSDKGSIGEAAQRSRSAVRPDQLPDQEPEHENQPRGRH